MKIYVEGRLKKRSWQDREGNTRYNVEIVGDEMTILSKPETQEKRNPPYSLENRNSENSPIENMESEADDVLPF